MKELRSVKDVRYTKSSMVAEQVMFGRVVGQIGITFALVDMELFLDSAVVKLIETHIYGFGASLCDRVCKNAFRRVCVKLEGN